MDLVSLRLGPLLILLLIHTYAVTCCVVKSKFTVNASFYALLKL